MDVLPDYKRIDVHCPKCGIVIPNMATYCPICMDAAIRENLKKPVELRKTDKELETEGIKTIYHEVYRMGMDPRHYSRDFPIYDRFSD